MKISPIFRHINIPNLITTLGLVFGIFTAYFLTQQNLRLAIIMLFFAGTADLFDGFVASKLNQQSEFGKYLDTLVDFFTCVIMPIWMVFDLLDGGPFLFTGLVIYCICGLWRLANYSLSGGGKGFVGLPVPAAMSLVTMTIWSILYYNVPVFVGGIVFILVAMLMISSIPLQKYGRWQVAFGLLGLAFLILVILS